MTFPRCSDTDALSMLLKRALQTCILGFALNAISRISVPICSPSRSQSVQMNRMDAYLACASMLLATAFLSCERISQLHVIRSILLTSAMLDTMGASNSAEG